MPLQRALGDFYIERAVRRGLPLDCSFPWLSPCCHIAREDKINHRSPWNAKNGRYEIVQIPEQAVGCARRSERLPLLPDILAGGQRDLPRLERSAKPSRQGAADRRGARKAAGAFSGAGGCVGHRGAIRRMGEFLCGAAITGGKCSKPRDALAVRKGGKRPAALTPQRGPPAWRCQYEIAPRCRLASL